MPNPSTYAPSYDFSAYQETNSTPLPGVQVDIQFADIATALTSQRSAIMDVRRSDGALKNGIVTADSLSPSLTIGFTNRGTWMEGESYSAGDGVVVDEAFYSARVANVATALNAPTEGVDNATWRFLFTFASIIIADGSVSPVKLDASEASGFRTVLGLGTLAVENVSYLASSTLAASAKTALVDADLVAIVDTEALNVRKKITWANIKAGVFTALGGLIAAGTGKATPADGDTLVLSDSAASGATKKLTWANLVVGVLAGAVTALFAKLDVEDQVLTGGARVTSKDLGTQSSGTLTLDPGDRPLQHCVNNGAFTLAPGSNTGSLFLDITNGASAGTITTSGFTKVTGDLFTTTNGHKFRCMVVVGPVGSLLQVQAMQ